MSEPSSVEQDKETRCRLLLVVPSRQYSEEEVSKWVNAGDIASVILPVGEMDEPAYTSHVELITPIAQAKGIAVLVEQYSQVMGRSGADGMFVTGGLPALSDAIARFSPKKIVGYGSPKNRHSLMEAGELEPDFVFLGKIDGDIKPEPHPKNLQLAAWGNELMNINLVVMGGNEIDSVVETARHGADFVALSKAVFDHPEGAAEAIKICNELLDQEAAEIDL